MPKMKKSEISLNEKDALQDMLNAEKTLLNMYSLAIIEGSSKQIRNSFNKNYQSAANGQFTVFEEMTTRGFYPVSPAGKTDIDEAIENFKTMSEEISAN